MSGDTVERFATRKAALEWLRANGYKISQGKFYQDCNAGYPYVHKDGSVSKFQVLEYGQKLDLEARSAAAVAAAASEYNDRKMKADAIAAEIKAKRMEREEDARWLYAVDAWAQVAALLGTLRDNLRHQVTLKRREIVHAAAGDQDRSDEVAAFVIGLIDDGFNETAGETIDVTFEREVTT